MTTGKKITMQEMLCVQRKQTCSNKITTLEKYMKSKKVEGVNTGKALDNSESI
jgi:hypothetical protein